MNEQAAELATRLRALLGERDGWEYPPYAVLSISRVWASLVELDALHTEDSGAARALARLRENTRPLELALESYRTHGRDVEDDRAEFDGYARTVADAVHTLRP